MSYVVRNYVVCTFLISSLQLPYLDRLLGNPCCHANGQARDAKMRKARRRGKKEKKNLTKPQRLPTHHRLYARTAAPLLWLLHCFYTPRTCLPFFFRLLPSFHIWFLPQFGPPNLHKTQGSPFTWHIECQACLSLFPRAWFK